MYVYRYLGRRIIYAVSAWKVPWNKKLTALFKLLDADGDGSVVHMEAFEVTRRLLEVVVQFIHVCMRSLEAPP